MVVLVAAIMMLIQLSAPGTVSADPNIASQGSEVCTLLDDLGVSHGACVSLYQSFFNSGNTAPVFFCQYLDLLGVLPTNIGQCVSALRAL